MLIEYITLSQSYYHIDVIFTISCDDNEGSFVRTIQYQTLLMKQNRILIALFILNYIILSINLLQFKFIKNLPMINSCMILNLINND